MDRVLWGWLGTLLIIAIGFSVIINMCLVCLFVVKRRYRKSYHQAYINLAISDSLYSLWGVIFTAPNYFFGEHRGPGMCEVVAGVSGYLLSTNLLAVTPIALDRLIAVYLPMRYKAGLVHRRVLKISILGVWILPAIYAIILHAQDSKKDLITVKRDDDLNLSYCELNPHSHLYAPFKWSRFVLFYCIPIVMVITAYSFIIGRLCMGGYIQNHTMSSLVIVIRAALVCLIIFVSWTPYAIVSIVHDSDALSSHLICYSVFYLGCLCNPFLYVVSSKAIRASLRRITKKRRTNKARARRRQVFSDVGMTTRRPEGEMDGVVAMTVMEPKNRTL